MKNKLLVSLLAASCVAASCLPNLLINPTPDRLIVENITLDEASEEASWGEIYRDADAYQKAYQESLDAYNKQVAELTEQFNALQADPQMANLTELYKQIEKAEKEKVVKGIKGDGKGNAIVTYANGTKDTICIYDPKTALASNSNPSNETVTDLTHDYEKVGYKVPIDSSFNYNYFDGTRNYTISNIVVKLNKIDSPSKYDPNYHFYYQSDFDIELSTPIVYSLEISLALHCGSGYLGKTYYSPNPGVENVTFNGGHISCINDFCTPITDKILSFGASINP